MFFRFLAWLLRSAYLVTKPLVRSGTEGPCCVPGHPKAVGSQSGVEVRFCAGHSNSLTPFLANLVRRGSALGASVG